MSTESSTPKELARLELQDSEDTYAVADGGLRAWCSIVGGWLSLTAVYGYQNAFGVYQDVYTRSHAASTSRISWIGSTQLFFMVALALPAGKLLDMGYFRWTTFVGSLIYVFSLFMVSLAHPDKYYQVFLSQGLGIGIGTGLIYVPTLAVQAHHWRKHRALAMGIVITGSSVGGIFFPIMLNRLFQGSAGFAWGVRASAFVVMGLLIPANILMSSNPPPASHKRPKPDIKILLTDAPYMLGIIGVLVLDWGFFLPYFYIQLFAILHGVDASFSFYTLAIMNGCSIPGRILPNIFARKYGVFNMLIIAAFACAVLILAMFGIKTTASTVIFCILYGFFSGAFLSLLSPAVASLSRDDSEIGLRLGMAFFLTSIGTLTGTPIDGALLGETFPWWKAIVWSAVTVIVGASLIVAARQILVRRKGTPYV